MPKTLDKLVAMCYIIYDVLPFQLDLYSKKRATKNARMYSKKRAKPTSSGKRLGLDKHSSTRYVKDMSKTYEEAYAVAVRKAKLVNRDIAIMHTVLDGFTTFYAQGTDDYIKYEIVTPAHAWNIDPTPTEKEITI